MKIKINYEIPTRFVCDQIEDVYDVYVNNCITAAETVTGAVCAPDILFFRDT